MLEHYVWLTATQISLLVCLVAVMKVLSSFVPFYASVCHWICDCVVLKCQYIKVLVQIFTLLLCVSHATSTRV